MLADFQICISVPLRFDQNWKLKIDENYKPLRVWLWIVYKNTENNYRLQLLTENFDRNIVIRNGKIVWKHGPHVAEFW